MKRITNKQRMLDVRRTIAHRRNNTKIATLSAVEYIVGQRTRDDWIATNNWIDKEIEKGLVTSNKRRGKGLRGNGIIIHLPSRMDFSINYDSTIQCLTAIRKLVFLYECYGGAVPKKAYKLASVNFDMLTSISTSAALVLTAEVSKWNIAIKRKLTPQVENWSKNIYIQLEQLGFFDLFINKPTDNFHNIIQSPDMSFVRYVTGQCGNSQEAKQKKRELKNEIIKLVGDNVDKWTILHSGLSEAVTNVTHHAYPGEESCEKQCWYLTGSFNKKTKEMKIAFYDQGVGIPNSLPASEIWEKVLSYFSTLKLPRAEQSKHAKLLEAAVSIDRTSTAQNDRGKGLQDLLEFIRERGEGYLSILSYHGLYKYWMENGKENSKTVSMKRPILGTLIIWSVNLN